MLEVKIAAPGRFEEAVYEHADLGDGGVANVVAYRIRASEPVDEVAAFGRLDGHASEDGRLNGALLAAAVAHLVCEVVSWERGGEPVVRVNGVAVTDSSVRQAVLGFVPGLAVAVGVRALQMRREVEEQRGN